jgi:vancomycin permeability regulator SanA
LECAARAERKAFVALSIRSRRPAYVCGALAALVLACNAAVIAGGTPFDASAAETADCALVLGARVYENGDVSQVLEDRLQTALDLYRAGKVSRILVSGDHHKDGYDEVNAMRRWLEARGVPPGDVFLDHAGLDTYSSMARAREVFRARRVIVVTQRFHLPRALYIARALGLEADGAPADRRVYRGAIWFELREIASRTRAVVDVTTHRTPRHLGPSIPISGDGLATRD